MSKIVNISEKRFKSALKGMLMNEINSEYDPTSNQEPFEFDRSGTPYDNTEDGHGEGIVGKPTDPTVYDKNAPDDIVNV